MSSVIRLGASLEILREKVIEDNSGDSAEPRRRAMEVLVRKVPDDQQVIGQWAWLQI